MIRSPRLWAVLLIWICFWPAALALPRAYLFDIVNSLSVWAGLFLLWAYREGVVNAFIQPPKRARGGHYLIIGIFIGWMGLSTRHVWNWTWRYLGEPRWMIDHVFVAFLVFVVFTSGCFHLLATNAVEGHIPRSNWYHVTGAIVCALATAAFVIFFLEPSGGVR